MEKSKKALFLTLALIFIGMFLIASVLAAKEYTGNVYHASPQIVQTYKSYNTNEITNFQVKAVQTYYLNKHEDAIPHTYNNINYYSRTDNTDRTHNQVIDNSIHYTQYGTETTRDNLFGDYVKEYSAYVTNRGDTGRYFTVTFNLENKNGDWFSQSVTQYLKTGEKRQFLYKDIQYEKNEILDWNYDIAPVKY
jgi:hypothetical protein